MAQSCPGRRWVRAPGWGWPGDTWLWGLCQRSLPTLPAPSRPTLTQSLSHSRNQRCRPGTGSPVGPALVPIQPGKDTRWVRGAGPGSRSPPWGTGMRRGPALRCPLLQLPSQRGADFLRHHVHGSASGQPRSGRQEGPAHGIIPRLAPLCDRAPGPGRARGPGELPARGGQDAGHFWALLGTITLCQRSRGALGPWTGVFSSLQPLVLQPCLWVGNTSTISGVCEVSVTRAVLVAAAGLLAHHGVNMAHHRDMVALHRDSMANRGDRGACHGDRVVHHGLMSCIPPRQWACPAVTPGFSSSGMLLSRGWRQDDTPVAG
ncbi:uncharacterized protein LOC121342813 [Onychostruthus taczanowskii]|uniref:uncharacterized protein LOC121342813 n=1 Tax=Onychostruthus taczanowskii TaxID=356909 RepID=UPI001B803118|nr:uncharacterized protein LOC121342813 [Onychostruthus taczanowskii]